MSSRLSYMSDELEREFVDRIAQIAERRAREHGSSVMDATAWVAGQIKTRYPELALAFVLRRPDGQAERLRIVDRLIAEREAESGGKQ